MTTLKCSVNACASNHSGCCCRPSIQVEGPSACKCSETCCESFVPKGRGEASNSIRYSAPNSALDVCCDACTCVHNDSGKCAADCVCINCCSSGTQCTSFEAR